MPLGNKKNQDFSKVRGLLGRSERSLSLAAPKGMQLRLCDRSALSPAGSCPSGNVIREGASRFVSSAPPPPSPFWFFLSPVCTISLSPSLQCVPIPLFCDWPSPRVYIISEALVESQWGLCNLCSSPQHTCIPSQTLAQLLPQKCCWYSIQALSKTLIRSRSTPINFDRCKNRWGLCGTISKTPRDEPH